MKNFKWIALKVILSLAAVFLGYWFMLPPLNFRSVDFYTFIIYVIAIVFAIFKVSSLFSAIKEKNAQMTVSPKEGMEKFKKSKWSFKIPIIAMLLLALFILVGNIIGAEIFNAKRYNRLLTITDGDFTAEVSEINRQQIPVVDRDTASRLGQRKLGEMADLVSQFEIEELYTQINYNGKPVRVTPLMYGDIIKWFNNHKNGIPAYIMVDMTTQETTLVRLEGGIKYSDSEYFMRDIRRKLRFSYPTKIFDEISFEIDDNGTPYWVASTIEYRIGIFSGKDIGGAVLFNAQTGESKYYDVADIPTWVDQIYSSEMIIDQLTYNGKYRSGYFNSIFGQKGVLQPTDGYNYLAINDDVWLYTGITSVTSDESNVGFVLTNLRTKETKYYPVPGAEEYSAMSSAQGQVQHLGYKATFPLLLNVSGRPSYFMALKDSAGLVKMYAFVDVQQYQIVGTGSTVEESRTAYLEKLGKESVQIEGIEEKNVSGSVKAISNAVVNGNTCYFIMLNEYETVFTVEIGYSNLLPFLKEGDGIDISYTETEGKISVTKVTIK